jgi:hypothetical protein
MRTKTTPHGSAPVRPEGTTARKPQPLSVEEQFQRYKNDLSFQGEVDELMEAFPNLDLQEAIRVIVEG